MKIFSLNIGKHSLSQLLRELTELLHNEDVKGKAIYTPNPEICLKTLKDPEFLEILEQADYLTSDGIGLYLAYQINDILSEYRSFLGRMIALLLLPYFLFNILFRKKYLYKKYGERICGSDLTTSLLEYAQHQKIHIAIIDPYYPNDAKKCISQEQFREKLLIAFPRLLFDFYVYSEENSQEIFKQIQNSPAKVFFSTLGMKKQEISVARVLDECPNIKLGLGIGSSFDYYTGFQKRAPKILRDFGFEWLYRIFTSPNKLQRLRRIYQALIIFPIKIIFYKK